MQDYCKTWISVLNDHVNVALKNGLCMDIDKLAVN